MDNGSQVEATTTALPKPDSAPPTTLTRVPSGPHRRDGAAQPQLLPGTSPQADLPRNLAPRLPMALVFGLTLIVYLAFAPHVLSHNAPPTGDQPFYLMDTISLVEDRDLELSNNYARRDEDKFYRLGSGPLLLTAPYPLPPQLTESTARPPGEWYASHLPGLSILLIPAWLVGSIFSSGWPATVVFMCILGALAGLNVFMLAYELTGKLPIALAVWLAIGFSGPIMSYSYLLFTELPTGLLLIYAFRRLAFGWGANGPGRLLLVGACIAYIPWMAWRCVPIAAALGLYAGVQWLRYRRASSAESDASGESSPTSVLRLPSSVRRLPGLGLFLLPIVASAGLVSAWHLFLFGSITPGAGGSLVRGQAAIFHWPWAGVEELSRFMNGAFGLLFDRQMGFLIYAPIYILAGVGMIAMFRSPRTSDRRLLMWIALFTLPYMGVVAAFEWWNGVWCPPARYLVTFAPLMGAPLAMSLAALYRSWTYRAIYGLLALPGFVLMAFMLADSRFMWPANSLLGWPFRYQDAPESPIRVDLRRTIPLFTPPDEILHPINTAWLIAFVVGVVLVGYLLMVRHRTMRRERTLPYAAHGAVWLAALSVVGLGWYTMNLEYLKHKTVLVEQNRWTLSPPVILPRGVTHREGKIYVADYAGSTVGAFDLATNSYTLLQPTDEDGALQFASPGDVKFGPDGLLYVLNNGEAGPPMYAMQPDGKVERKQPLNGKSQTSIGLDFGPDGKMYVADMRGGKVLKYELSGGEPLANLGGESGGYNNIAGIAIAENGRVYIAEGSARRVQEMRPNGSFVRDYELPCEPMYLALSGDWLDVTCGSNIFSINRQAGSVQWSRPSEESEPLQGPTGLTYAPDGTLYVLDGSTLIAYKVEH